MRRGSGGTESRGESGGGFDAAEKVLEAAPPFVNALDGCGVGQAQVAGSAEGIAGNEGDTRVVEKQLGKFGGVFGERTAAAAIGQVRGDIGERVERAAGILAGDDGNGSQAGDDAETAPRVFAEQPL